MSDEQRLYPELGRKQPGSEEANMFGKPCFKTNGKAFVCFFNNAMVFKLNGETHQEALSLDGAVLFDPSGKNRPMKEWVQVPSSSREKWTALTLSALDYVQHAK